MASDPWHWNSSEVATFFRDNAETLVADVPNARLPDLNSLAQKFEENDVCGYVLFNAVDVGFLRDDCGIKSLGQRSAVVHCIRKLKARSSEWLRTDGGNAPQTPVSLEVKAAVKPDPEKRPLSPVPVFDSANTKRAAEVQVEDRSGRKRRKLDLTVDPTLVSTLRPQSQRSSSLFLGNRKLPVDGLFFSDTRIGQEVQHSVIPNTIMDDAGTDPSTTMNTDDDDLQESDTCFQFQIPNVMPGEAAFVHSRMRHFLNLNISESRDVSVREISRRAREALAVLPYTESLLSGTKPRSALVIQPATSGCRYIAKRENAALLDSGFDYGDMAAVEGLPEGSESGEWDFLAAKHKPSENDELLPLYEQSESEGSLRSLQEEMQVEQEVDELEQQQAKPAGARLDTMIDNAFHGLASTWKVNRLPPMEEKKAWPVWRRMRQSRSIRTQLIDAAHDLINHLENRLQKFREEMHRSEWRSQAEVTEQCKIMDATIEDIEEQRWKIDVWRRKKEPCHVARRGVQFTSGVKPPATSTQQQAPHIPMADRFSVERDVAVDDATSDDVFHSAQGELDQSGSAISAQEEDQDASDEMSEHNNTDFIDDAELTDGDHNDVAQPSSDSLDGRPGHSEFGHDTSYSSLNVPKSKVGHTDYEYTDDARDAESENLSSPSKWHKTAGKEETSTSILPQTPAIQLIEISSDSTPSETKPPKKRKKRPIFSATPEEDPAQEVASWDLDDLVEAHDRKRIMIKLLYKAGPEMRQAIHRKIKALRVPSFVTAMMNVLEALSQDFMDSNLDVEVAVAAKIFLAHKFLRPDCYLEDSAVGIPWPTAVAGELEITTFCRILLNVLEKANLWRLPKPAHPKSAAHSSFQAKSNIIDLVDDSEDDELQHDAQYKNKRRKLVKLSASAEQSQAAAFRRQQRFRELQSAGSNSQELQAMIQSDPSKSSVVINPLATEHNGLDLIFIHKRIARSLKEHQVNGIQFMWREVTAGGDEGGQGCILAHTMGLGKTLQTIATLIAINEAAQSDNPRISGQLPAHLRPHDIKKRQLRMLILLPSALVQNWQRELDHWASEVLKNRFAIVQGLKPHRVIEELKKWYKVGGILFVTYGLFQKYVNWGDSKDEAKLRELGPQLDKYLVDGPEIVVADEVHILKNHTAKVTKAAKRLRTESRIGLTGTPMSNDVDEIYSLVSFAAPNYLGEKKWFNQQYSNPIAQGNRSDSTREQVRKMLKRLAVLRKQIEPKVNRADINVLRGSLKPKTEFVIMMPLSDIQRVVYSKYLDALSKDESNLNGTISQTRIFAWLSALTLLMNHPLAFKRKLMEPSKTKPVGRKATPPASDSGSTTPVVENDIDPDELPSMDQAIKSLSFSDEVKSALCEGISNELRPETSKKIELLLIILRLAGHCDDKVLVFSQTIPTLNYIGDLLKKHSMQFGRIDGGVAIPKRQQIIEDFHSGATKIMLMSTKTAVGLNIQGANRVVILDFGFNPSHEEQAIGRAYRIGQQKPVFVYRLVIGGTFEDNIYDKQMFKTSLTQRVVDKKNPRRIALGSAGDWLYVPKDLPQEDIQQWLGKDEAILHKILKKQLADEDYKGPQIRRLTTIETLQEDAADPPLDETEQREVEEELAERRNQRMRDRQTAHAGPLGLGASQSTMQPPRVPRPTAPMGGYARPSNLAMVRLKLGTVPHGLPGTGNAYHPPATMPVAPPAQPGAQQNAGINGARPTPSNPHFRTHGLP